MEASLYATHFIRYIKSQPINAPAGSEWGASAGMDNSPNTRAWLFAGIYSAIIISFMNFFEVFSKWNWIGIAFGTAWSFASIRFLWSRITTADKYLLFPFLTFWWTNYLCTYLIGMCLIVMFGPIISIAEGFWTARNFTGVWFFPCMSFTHMSIQIFHSSVCFAAILKMKKKIVVNQNSNFQNQNCSFRLCFNIL